MSQIILLLPTIFWLWMIYECVRNDPERHIWLWILIFLNFPGALIYFVVRKLPQMNVNTPINIKRWTYQSRLWNAEAAAMNIGKAYQYEVLGNLYLETEQWDKAADAYNTTLEKEPSNIQALWGLASIKVRKKDFEAAKEHLGAILKLDPEYKYGEASLLYIKTILSLKEIDQAKNLLQEHIHTWRKAEAYLMMAKIQAEQGEVEEARTNLETMLRNLRCAPEYQYKQNRHLVRQAKNLLKAL